MTETFPRTSGGSEHFDGRVDPDPPARFMPQCGARTQHGGLAGGLARDLVELDLLLAHTPVFIHDDDGTVQISDLVRELLARKRMIVHELRRLRALQRGAANTPWRTSSMATVVDAPGPGLAGPATGPPHSQTVHGVDVDAVARALLDCRHVMGLGNEIATYLDGRRIAGVRADPQMLEAHVLGSCEVSTEQLLAEVSAAITPLARGRHIDIVVVEVVEPHPFDPAD